MKATYWIILILLILLGYTGYVGVIAPANLQLDQPEIILKVNQGQLSLEPQNSHKCGAGDKPGCVQFDQKTLGTITFRIQNGPKDTGCNTPPKPQWVITKVELTADELPPAGSGKGDYSKPIPAWLSDAFPQINSLTGVVYEASLNFGTSSAVIVDLNNNDGEKIIYYKVTASSCQGGQTLTTDPMVRNEGK